MTPQASGNLFEINEPLEVYGLKDLIYKDGLAANFATNYTE